MDTGQKAVRVAGRSHKTSSRKTKGAKGTENDIELDEIWSNEAKEIQPNQIHRQKYTERVQQRTDGNKRIDSYKYPILV